MKISSITGNYIFKRSAAVFFFRICGMIFSYVAVFIITNYLGAEAYGRFALIQTIFQFSILLFSLGVGVSIVKLTADTSFFENNIPKNSYLLNSIILIVISSVFFSLIVFLSSKWLAIDVFNDQALQVYFRYLPYLFVFILLNELFTEFLRGKNLFVQYGILKYFLPPLFFAGILWVTIKNNSSEEYLFLYYMIPFLLTLAVSIFYIPVKRLQQNNRYRFKEILKLSTPMMFTATFVFLTNWTDVFMLGAMVSKSDLGIYNVAFKIASLSLVIIHAINTVLAPRLSSSFSNNDMETLKKDVQYTTKLIILLTAPILLVILIFGPQILGIFGEEFKEGTTVLAVIAIGFALNAMSGSVAQVLNMTNHQKQLQFFTLLCLIVNIVLNYILIPWYGIVGAAISSLVSTLFINTCCIIYIKREFGFITFFNLWK